MSAEGMRLAAVLTRGQRQMVVGPKLPVYSDGYADPQEAHYLREHVHTALVDGRGDDIVNGLDALVERIRTLEAALLPLAARAVVMQSIRMNLMAVRTKNPRAGGTWIWTDEGLMALYTEDEHYAAYDAVGRERTRLYMADEINRKSVENSAANQLRKHVNDGGRIC